MLTPRTLPLNKPAEEAAFRLYNTLKPLCFEPGLDSSRSRSTSKRADASARVCKQRLNDVLKAFRELEQRVAVLTQANALLHEEIASLKAINKRLLNDRLPLSPDESRNLMQDVLITEANNHMYDAKREVERLRGEAERQRTRAGVRGEDNRKLQCTLNRYRKLLSQSLQTRPLHSSIQQRELPKLVQSSNGPKLHSAKASTPKLLAYLNSLLLEANLKTVLSEAVNTCKAVLGCKQCSVFILCPSLQETYASCFDKGQQPIRLLLGRVWMLMHADLDCADPVFEKPEHVGRGFIGDDHLVFPVTVKKQTVMIVQCTQISQTPIEHIAELQLKVIITGIQFALAHIANVQTQELLDFRIDRTSAAMNAIAACTNHCELSNAVHSTIPDTLGFEAAGLVFVDEEAHEFFVNVVAAGGDERYCYDVLRYPNTIGVAANVLRTRGVKVFDDIKRLGAYTADVDNLTGVRIIHSAVFACLPGPHATAGVLVLINKRDSTVTAKDLAVIESVRKVLGAFVAGINYTAEAMELTLRMKETAERLVVKACGKTGPYSQYTTKLSDQLHLVLAKLTMWENRRGQPLDNT